MDENKNRIKMEKLPIPNSEEGYRLEKVEKEQANSRICVCPQGEKRVVCISKVGDLSKGFLVNQYYCINCNSLWEESLEISLRGDSVVFNPYKWAGYISVLVSLILGLSRVISPFLTVVSILFFGLLLIGVHHDHKKWKKRYD